MRPVLNLKLEKDAKTMRAIAEEAFAMVKAYKGSHSGEHGDGLVRSEFHEKMYGAKTVRLFEEVKDRFDPGGLMNPGKIVRASRMDDRTLFRFKPDYRVPEMRTALDWSAYPGAGGGFQGAVEMCNNNGECRKHVGGVMCPSFRVTGNERDVTRGRANRLRLAISGQLGPDALASDEMLETMKLCVSCKGCRRECPTGVDMAKMKIEVLAAANRRRGLSLRDRLVAYLPRYAPYAVAPRAADERAQCHPRPRRPHRAPHRPLRQAPAPPLAPRCVSRLRALPSALRRGEGRGEGQPQGPTSAASPLTLTPPRKGRGSRVGERRPREVALFADTFNTYFEPENLHAAVEVLTRLGYRVTPLLARADGGRPLCCGRTFLSAGLVEEARAEARRVLAAAAPFLARGVPIVGLEPSCLLTLRDEFLSMLPGAETERLAAPGLPVRGVPGARGRRRPHRRSRSAGSEGKVLLHGHCHQKAFGAMGSVERGAGAGRGPRGRDRGVELLRHGRRLRLRRRHLRGVDGHGRAVPAAGRAPGRARHRHRRRRLLLPPPDPRRHRPPAAARRAHPARRPCRRRRQAIRVA